MCINKTRPWRGIEKTDIAAVIARYVIGQHAARNREVLKACWIDGVTREACADSFEMSPRRINQILSDWYPLIDEKLKQYNNYSCT